MSSSAASIRFNASIDMRDNPSSRCDLAKSSHNLLHSPIRCCGENSRTISSLALRVTSGDSYPSWATSEILAITESVESSQRRRGLGGILLPERACIVSRRAHPTSTFVEPLEQRLLAARIKGLDVSQFQNTMNFTTAYNAGDRFVFHRASRTDTVPDQDVHENVPNAKGAGLLVGVYHRIFPLGDANDASAYVDPIADANNFLASGSAYMGIGYMRPVVDVEDGTALNGSPAHGGHTLSSWVNAFVDHVQLAVGVTPLIYCNTNY